MLAHSQGQRLPSFQSDAATQVALGRVSVTKQPPSRRWLELFQVWRLKNLPVTAHFNRWRQIEQQTALFWDNGILT